MATPHDTSHADNELDQERRLIAAFDHLPLSRKRHVTALMNLLRPDVDDSMRERLRRHLRGERVAETYLDTRTGEYVQVPEGALVPERHLPVLDALA